VASSAEPGDGPVPAITRAAAILDVLADRNGVPVSASDLARILQRPKSSTANLCTALESTGLISRRAAGYVLGRKLAELGGRFLSSVDEVTEFYQLCRRSAVLSRETVRASVLDGLDVLYLARYDGVQPLRMTANIGDRFPATCTATGKAMMAYLDPAVLTDRLRGTTTLPALTARSITSVPELLAQLEVIRERGWAIDDQETTIGVTCFAIAVGPPRAPARFAVSVTTLTSRLGTEVHQEDLIRELQIVADGMTSPLTPH
jgi:DNA-binding IclR family transcriptional regulator